MCSQEGLLDFENEDYVAFYLLSGQSSAPPPLHLGVSVHRGQTPAVQPGAHLSPASGPLRKLNIGPLQLEEGSTGDWYLLPRT